MGVMDGDWHFQELGVQYCFNPARRGRANSYVVRPNGMEDPELYTGYFGRQHVGSVFESCKVILMCS